MARVAWYRYSFSDGYVSINRGKMNKNELRRRESEHGKAVVSIECYE